MRHLVITADDFGMSLEVNEAVEIAHREGILTGASLLMAGDAVDDAIRRARRMPRLGIGLHLALYGALAMSGGATAITPDGRNLGKSPLKTGTAIILSQRVRAAARREVGAQFEAYRRSGLPLGHLDGHWHCHENPALLAMALEFGKPMGLRAVRIPYETFGLTRRISGWSGLSRLPNTIGQFPLALAMRRQIARAGLRANDHFFGKSAAGAITEPLLARLVSNLPMGVTEVGLHPSTKALVGPHAPPAHWQLQRELAALVSPTLKTAITASGIQLSRWADIA
jgi:hopanoid biosynthesis associated protein HpnK